MAEQGWQPDPTGRFDERYFVRGQPTDLVRSSGEEQIDPMPLAPPLRQEPGLPPPPAPSPAPVDEADRSTSGGSRRAWLLIAAVVGALLLVGIVGAVVGDGGEEASTSTSPPRPATTDRPTTTTSSPTTTVVAEHFTRDNYERLVTNPKRYTGSTVDIVGKVFGEIEREGDLTVFQMFADPSNSGWNTAVAFRGELPFPLITGMYIRVRGTVLGDVSGTNLFGGTVKAVAVEATSIEQSDATAAASPALREVAVGASRTQHGLTITLDTVQYAAEETRVFITVTNDSGDSASFYDFNAKARRGSQQFDATFSLNDYPEVQSDILPGVTSSGVVVFDAMDPAPPTQFIFEARTMDYRLDFVPYVFDVPGA